MMKGVLVGGPLLGQRRLGDDHASEPISWRTFEPLISDEIERSGGKSERFVLLPNSRFVSVLALKTGKRLGMLLMPQEKENEFPAIECVSLATYPKRAQSVKDLMASNDKPDGTEEHVVLVGCSDGTLREFCLSELTKPSFGKKLVDCGPYQIAAPAYRPRRVFRVSEEGHPIKHLTVPHLAIPSDGIVAYAVVEKSRTQKGASIKVQSSLMRLLLPMFDETAKSISSVDLTSLDNGSHIHLVDNLKHHAGKSKKNSKKSAPFRILSSASRKSSQSAKAVRVTVFVARPTVISFYCEELSESSLKSNQQRALSVSFPVPGAKMLSAVCLAPNGKDVACGCHSGEILVINNLLTLVEDYAIGMEKYQAQTDKNGSTVIDKPTHPSKTAMPRKLHWHAHPVTSLNFFGGNSAAEPMLYSGGEESVLVVWQLARGTSKPADVLPRIALGGIVHIACLEQSGQPNSILVYCSDNSLQLFESHDHSSLWKFQGVATVEEKEIISSNPMVRADPGNDDAVILTSLPNAPGYIHWYDPREQRVKQVLEVAPYNRVSRTEPGDNPMPSPTIVHAVWSKSGDDLVTVDTIPTENPSIGFQQQLQNGTTVGVVTTLRFWAAGEGGRPYELTAAMSYPHGPDKKIAASALSNDGKYVCTVSNDEKAFRVWRKVSSESSGENKQNPAWLCRYKITTPSGYSNMTTGHSAAAFSTDGSILAIGYGSIITLWDHHEATLLASLRHLDGIGDQIDSIQFLSTGSLPDMLLTRSSMGVTLQSPYGSRGPENMGWSWALPDNSTAVRVCFAEFLPALGQVAVVLYDEESDSCKMVFVEAVTGQYQEMQGAIAPTDAVPGKIISVAAVGQPVGRSNWNCDSTKEAPARLYLLSNSGNLLLFSNKSDDERAKTGLEEASKTDVPSVPLLASVDGNVRKRPRIVLNRSDLGEAASKKILLEQFGAVAGDGDEPAAPLASEELPNLHGAFARAFVGRHLWQE